MSTDSLNYCPSCGTKLTDQPNFCPKCGKNLLEASLPDNKNNNSARVEDKKSIAELMDERNKKFSHTAQITEIEDKRKIGCRIGYVGILISFLSLLIPILISIRIGTTTIIIFILGLFVFLVGILYYSVQKNKKMSNNINRPKEKFNIYGILILIIVFFFLNPREETHQEKIKDYVNANLEPNLFKGLGLSLVERYLSSNFQRTNYILFSIGSLKSESGDLKNVTFGILGYVWFDDKEYIAVLKNLKSQKETTPKKPSYIFGE